MIGVGGHYDNQGNACITMHLAGVRHQPPGPEYTGILDTGFTGFLQVPYTVAFALSLPLEGTNTITLADGSSHVALMVLVEVTLDGRSETGVAILSDSAEVLIGMDFLRRFERLLVVSRSGIVLMDEIALEKAFQDASTPT